jgi:hypothetical protein
MTVCRLYHLSFGNLFIYATYFLFMPPYQSCIYQSSKANGQTWRYYYQAWFGLTGGAKNYIDLETELDRTWTGLSFE